MPANDLTAGQSMKTRLRPAGYWLVFTVPALLPLTWWLIEVSAQPLWTLLPVLWLYGLLPIADWLIGRDPAPPGSADDHWINRRLVPLLCLPVQLLVLFWALGQLEALPLWARLWWLISLGSVGGVLAINVAHELIHRKSRLDRTVGGLLLSTVNYAGFKIEHVRGHHVWVATEHDASSARRGRNLYTFIPRALVLNTIRAWQLESRRLARIGKSAWSLRNELIGWYLVVFVLAAVAWWLHGGVGLVGFFVQGLIAAITLEMINYIEHYGLERRRLANGRLERPLPRHSWNSDYWLSNAMLLQLQRHADHHAHPSRPYTRLQSHLDAPQLPAGYAGMMSLAMIPPLWRRVMHKRLEEQAHAERRPG